MRQLLSMKAESATNHGFRSSFRDWAGDETDFPRELAEAAISHVIGDKAEQASRGWYEAGANQPATDALKVN